MYISGFGDFGFSLSKILDPLKLREKVGPVKKYTEKGRVKRETKGKERAKTIAEEEKQIKEIERVGKATAAKEAVSINYTPFIIGGVVLIAGGAIFYYWKYKRK